MLNQGACGRAFGASVPACTPESANLPLQVAGGTHPLEGGVMTLKHASHCPPPVTHHSPLNYKKLLNCFLPVASPSVPEKKTHQHSPLHLVLFPGTFQSPHKLAKIP